MSAPATQVATALLMILLLLWSQRYKHPTDIIIQLIIHGYQKISGASLVPAFQIQDLWLLLRLYGRSPDRHNDVALQQMPIASVDLTRVVEDLQVDLRSRPKGMTGIKCYKGMVNGCFFPQLWEEYIKVPMQIPKSCIVLTCLHAMR